MVVELQSGRRKNPHPEVQLYVIIIIVTKFRNLQFSAAPPDNYCTLADKKKQGIILTENYFILRHSIETFCLVLLEK